jgi:beta-galactosidase
VATATAPTITASPASVTLSPGQTTTLSVVAAGTAPLAYQWQVANAAGAFANIASATSSSYTTGTAGTYRVVVSNAAGTATSATATITVASLPIIVEQPRSVTVAQGEGGTFSVVISAPSSVVSYQWQVLLTDWTAVTGANSSSYVATVPATYRVAVSNAAGSVFSDAVTLTVGTPPTIISEPQDYGGRGPANLTVIADGVGPFNYQWYFISPAGGPGQVITGATRDIFSTSASGSYFVRVSNAAGTVQSRTAVVSISGGPLP